MQKQEGESTADEAVVGGNEDEEIGMLSLRGRRDARDGDRAGEELGVM
jgi:hypothetical protein